jgi:hypothetical protein
MSSYYSDPYEAVGITEEALGELGDQVNPDSGAVELSEEENTIGEYDQVTSSGHEASSAAMEDFGIKFQTTLENLRSEEHPEMGDIKVALMAQQKMPQYHILSSDNRIFRVYFRSDIWFRDKEINGICRFLDTRTENQTVMFMLGVDMCTEQSSLVGPIISAIMTCKAKTVGLAMGLCSLPETMIWSYCSEREMLRYGAVCYSRPELIKRYPEYKPYYDQAFKRGVKIGIITDADIEQIYAKNAEIMKMYSDLHQV